MSPKYATDLSPWLKRELRAYRKSGARIAGRLLLDHPDRLGDRAIVDFLRDIWQVKPARTAKWMAGAGIHPLTPVTDLTVNQRRLLAMQLAAYAKERS